MKHLTPCPVYAGAVVLGLMTLLLPGCHDLTEYGDTGEAGVVFIDIESFEVRGTVPAIQGAKSLCSLGNDEIIVFCNNGTAWWLDSDALEVTESRVIGSPFSSGYTNAVVSAEGTIYLIGGYGGIIEIIPTSGIVLDEFPIGSVPAALCTAPDIGRLFVADGVDMEVREVWTGDNHVEKSLELDYPVAAMTWMDPQRYLPYDAAFVAVSGLESAPAYLVMTGDMFLTEELDLHGTFTDVAALTDTTIFAVVDPVMQSDHGSISVVFYHPEPEGCDVNEIPLDGHPLRVCTSGLPLAHRFYVASYLGNGSTRIFEVEMMTLEVVNQLDIPGYPIDMVVHAVGEDLVVLTQE